jgi:hypothetical protein
MNAIEAVLVCDECLVGRGFSHDINRRRPVGFSP